MADNEVGPKGFSRVFAALRNAFIGTPNTIIVPVASGVGDVPTSSKLQMIAVRHRVQDPHTKSRQRSTEEKLTVWDNRIADLVDTRLRNAFHPENYSRMFWVLHSSTNVLRRIVTDTSFLYENPARRTLEVVEAPEPITPPDDGTAATSPTTEKPIAEAKTAGDPTEEPPAPSPEADTLDTGDPDVDALADVLELSGSKTPQEQTAFDKLMEQFDFDTVLDLVEKLTCICPAVWVRPLVTYDRDEAGNNLRETGKLSFRIYTPDVADVVTHPENPTEAVAFYYYGNELMPNGEEKRVVHFWNKQTYLKFDMEWKVLAQSPNLFKRLPVTVFRKDLPRDGYYCDGVGDDLFEGTIEVNILKTLQNSRAKDSAFKQLAIQGDARDIPQDIVMGGPSPIVLGEENTALVLDLQANLEQFTTMWDRREVSIASTYGISAGEYKNEGNPQSGFAKKLDLDKMLKENRRRRKFFQTGEQDLYENLVATLSVNPLPGIDGLDPKAKLKVDFTEPTFEENPDTQARTDAQNLKFNSLSIIDILRRANPDLNDVELIKMAYRNKRINDAFMTTDQMKLVDLLSTRANVGGSFGQVGGGDGGEDGPPKDGPPVPPKGGGKFP